jgi:glutathione reductase (NADPH)
MYFDFVDEAHREPTVYKLIVYGEDEKVVGLHMVGQGSDEGIQGFSVAIKMGGASKTRLGSRCVFSPILSYKEEL